MGILKFRLYGIDRPIRRTISYAVLTATLVAVDLNAIHDDLLSAARTLQPSHVPVWIRPRAD